METATEITYTLFDEEQARAHLPEFIALLRDAVDSGASVGFLPPLDEDEAVAFWDGVFGSLGTGSRLLLAALAAGQVVGSVQLELASKPNARHRAEVQKLLVLRSHRQRGIGRELMERVQRLAVSIDRSLLVLDTIQGDTAEGLYRRMGFQAVGAIPEFAMTGSGRREPTVVFYKLLDPPTAE